MKPLIKTLALTAAGLVVGAVVVKRVKNKNNYNSTSNVVLDAKSISEQALKSATEALEKANSYSW